MDKKFKLITADRFIDGAGKSAVNKTAVLLENDVIRAGGPASELKAP